MRDDLFTVRKVYTLDDGERFGTLTAEYRAKRYRRASGLSDHDPFDPNIAEPETYLVSCKLRISVSNRSAAFPLKDVKAYTNYPVMLSSAVSINPDPVPLTSIEVVLRDYAPRSLNASVQTESYDSSSQGSSTTHTHSSGSSHANTSTASYTVFPLTDSWNTTTSDSNMKEDGTSDSEETGTQAGSSDNMSIKDWATNAFVSADYAAPTWVWNQEYPWDCRQYGDPSALPPFVIRRMWDGSHVFPPSSLSQFGVDFVTTASWEVKMGNRDPIIAFDHVIDCVTATHKAERPDPNGPLVFSVSVNHPSTTPVQLHSARMNLEKLALAPVGGAAAAVNLLHDRFRVPPARGETFSIRSRANNLLVNGRGFETAMVADLTTKEADVLIWFKVADERAYKLVFKHWLHEGDPCVMDIDMPDGTHVQKIIDDPYAAGGESNYLRIELRNNTYASANYHDYLVDGMNLIRVRLSKLPGTGSCIYALSAIAIV